MSECKLTLKEIYRGDELSDVATSHMAGCVTCNKIYQELSEIEAALLSNPPVDVPMNLKPSILDRACQEDNKKAFLPVVRFILRAAVLTIIMTIGYWLGLQTANGSNSSITNDIEISQSQVYLMNTEPVDSDSLSQIYFRVLKEENDG